MTMADAIQQAWSYGSAKAGPVPRFEIQFTDGSVLTVPHTEVGWSHDPISIYGPGDVVTYIPYSSVRSLIKYEASEQ